MVSNCADVGAIVLLNCLVWFHSVTMFIDNNIVVLLDDHIRRGVPVNNSMTFYQLDPIHENCDLYVYNTHIERLEQSAQSNMKPNSKHMRDASAEQVEEVFQELWSDTLLHDLLIDSTSLTADNMATLSSSLTINKTLFQVSLRCCDLDDHAVEELSTKLHLNTSLRRLDLFSNPRITDTGARHLATMLTITITLQYLGLSHCSITDSGVKHLSKGIQGNNTVTELDLSYNAAITDTGAESLSDMIKVNKSLSKLYLEGTSVGKKGADALIKSLLRNNMVVTELWPPYELKQYFMSHRAHDKLKNVVRFPYVYVE